MKLKKAVRELARAEFAYGMRAAVYLNADPEKPFYAEKVQRCKDARAEVDRCKRQLNAVMVAMQYRGKNKAWCGPQKREITHLRSREDWMNAHGRAAIMGCDRVTSGRYLAKQLEFQEDDIRQFKELLNA